MLPGISTEQLRSRLNRMVADGLLTRQRYREVPPRVDYELTERSRELMPVLGALARWGYDWTWSAPRPGEDVNVGAIFRLAPGHARAARRARGHASSCVVDADGELPERRYLLTIARRPRGDRRARAPTASRTPASAAPWRRGSARSAPTAAPSELTVQRPPRARRRAARRLRATPAARRTRTPPPSRRSLALAARRGARRVVVRLDVREGALELLPVERERVAGLERVLVLRPRSPGEPSRRRGLAARVLAVELAGDLELVVRLAGSPRQAMLSGWK